MGQDRFERRGLDIGVDRTRARHMENAIAASTNRLID